MEEKTPVNTSLCMTWLAKGHISNSSPLGKYNLGKEATSWLSGPQQEGQDCPVPDIHLILFL